MFLHQNQRSCYEEMWQRFKSSWINFLLKAWMHNKALEFLSAEIFEAYFDHIQDELWKSKNFEERSRKGCTSSLVLEFVKQ